jgi:hypothetical protein
MKMPAITLPELALPFATACHPDADAVQASTERWCRAFGLLRAPDMATKFHALGYGRVMSTLVPEASATGLALVVDWNSLFFIADDQQGSAIATGRVRAYEELADAMRRLIGGEPVPTDGQPLLAALRDLLERTLPGRPAYWIARFRRNLSLWLAGHLAENGYRLSNTVPDVASYIAARRDASTVFPTLDLVEMVEGATIPDGLHDSPVWRTLVLGTADIMCWINDIHSLHMETDDPINLVTVLAHRDGLTVRQAIDAVSARIAARTRDYLAAVEALPGAMDAHAIPAEARPAILRCVADQQSWAAGMEKWDRTDTIRFAASELRERGTVAAYVEDLLR